MKNKVFFIFCFISTLFVKSQGTIQQTNPTSLEIYNNTPYDISMFFQTHNYRDDSVPILSFLLKVPVGGSYNFQNSNQMGVPLKDMLTTLILQPSDINVFDGTTYSTLNTNSDLDLWGSTQKFFRAYKVEYNMVNYPGTAVGGGIVLKYRVQSIPGSNSIQNAPPFPPGNPTGWNAVTPYDTDFRIDAKGNVWDIRSINNFYDDQMFLNFNNGYNAEMYWVQSQNGDVIISFY